MTPAHPMAKVQNGSMGFSIPLLSNLEDKFHEYTDSAKQTLQEWGVSDADLNAIDKQAQAAIEEAKKDAAAQLAQQVTGGSFQPKESSIIPAAVQEQIDNIRQNPMLMYSIIGVVGLGALYLIMRK